MRTPPPLSAAPRYPVVGGTALLAIGVSVAYWAGVDVSALFADPHVRYGQLWRLITSTLPHANLLHLAFNLAWLWVFGTAIEEHCGQLRTLGLFILLAAISSAAQYAVLSGGIGLSGVVYGLWGMLWALQSRDRRFADVLDQRTNLLFVAWFFLCIVLTITHLMPIANVAHGFGAVTGALLGSGLASRTIRSQAAYAAGLAVLAVAVGGAIFAGRWINLSPERGEQEAYLGYTALMADKNQEAVRWCRDSVELRPMEAAWWQNFAIALDRVGQTQASERAFQRAADLAPDNPDYRHPSATLQHEWSAGR